MTPPPLPPGWEGPLYPPSDSGGRNTNPRRIPRRSRSSFFLYSVKIKNDGVKVITGIAWQYIVNDPADNSELSRHSFWTWEKVGISKSKSLEGKSHSPPSNVVSVVGLQKDNRSPFIEKVLLKCVLYEDGTTWSSPEAGEREHDCERLRLGPSEAGR